MSLPRIRLELCKALDGGLWSLDREQERHLVKVLRAYEGAMIEGLLPEGTNGKRFLLRLERMAEGMVLREMGRSPEEPENTRIHLLIGLLKSDQFDTVLRMAAELELFAVWPVICSRSVPRIMETEIPKKMQRWQKILDEGTKVSGSIHPPKMQFPVHFIDIDWSSLPKTRYAALLTPQTNPLSNISNTPEELIFAVGPEGDWSPEEMQALLDNDFAPVGLGRRILRASTAATVGCGWFRLAAG